MRTERGLTHQQERFAQCVASGMIAQRAVWIEDTMSRECRYDKRHEDPRCPVDCARRLNREGVADAEIINE